MTLQQQSVRRAEVDANDLSTVVYGMLRASRELPQMAEVTLDIPVSNHNVQQNCV